MAELEKQSPMHLILLDCANDRIYYTRKKVTYELLTYKYTGKRLPPW